MFTNKQIIKNTYWSGFEVISQQFIQILISIILARLLSPKDFGMFATISIFLYSGWQIIEGGLSGALTQNKNISDVHKSTVFWYNIFVSVLIFFVLWIFSKNISIFFNNTELTNVIRALSFNFILNGISNVHFSILQKELRFKERTIVGLVSIVISGFIGLYLAFSGFGVWSLVFQSLSFSFVKTLMLLKIYSWKPKLIFDYGIFRSMFSYGKNLMFCMLLRSIFQNIYNIVIGKLYSIIDLGFYDRGRRFAVLAYDTPSTFISRTLFPTLSVIQDDINEVRIKFNAFVSFSIILIWPILVGLNLTGDMFIHIILGEKWLPSVPYFKIICLIGMMYPIHILCYGLLNSLGHSKLSFQAELSKYTLTSIAIILSFNKGIYGLLIGEAIASFISIFIIIILSLRKINISLNHFLMWIIKPFIGCILMYLVLKNIYFNYNILVNLILNVLIGLFVYFGSLLLLKEKFLFISINNINNYFKRNE